MRYLTRILRTLRGVELPRKSLVVLGRRGLRLSRRRRILLACLPSVLLLTSLNFSPSPVSRSAHGTPPLLATTGARSHPAVEGQRLPSGSRPGEPGAVAAVYGTPQRSVGVRRTPASPQPSRTPTPTLTATASATPTAAPWPTPLPLPPGITPEPLPSIMPHPVLGFVPVPSPTLTATPDPSQPVRAAGTPRFIPILMYHYVRTVDPASDPLGYGLSVSPEEFAAQLDWLAKAGYTTVRMDTAVRCLRGEQVCPDRAIALTFDDGYVDAYTTVLPLLQTRGFVATFYIVSGFVGKAGYMGWEELRELRDAGMEIGAHSVNHLDLVTIGWEVAQREVSASRQQLAAVLEVPVESFCYPAGKFDSTIAALVREAGYTNATTTTQAWYQGDLYTLPRLRIDGHLTLDAFAWLVKAYTP